MININPRNNYSKKIIRFIGLSHIIFSKLIIMGNIEGLDSQNVIRIL